MEFFNFSGPHAEFSNIISYISVIYIQIFIQDELNGFITSPSRSISDPLKKIHDVIKAVREGPTPLPSTILYRFVIRKLHNALKLEKIAISKVQKHIFCYLKNGKNIHFGTRRSPKRAFLVFLNFFLVQN